MFTHKDKYINARGLIEWEARRQPALRNILRYKMQRERASERERERERESQSEREHQSWHTNRSRAVLPISSGRFRADFRRRRETWPPPTSFAIKASIRASYFYPASERHNEAGVFLFWRDERRRVLPRLMCIWSRPAALC